MTDSKIIDEKGYPYVFIPSFTSHSVSPQMKPGATMTLQADK